MVFSIHPKSHRGLSDAFSDREVIKSYLTMVHGRPAEVQGEIRSFLARRRASNRMKSVLRGGKAAVTRYRVLEFFEAAALLEVDILTGRTHQIRIHFAEQGHPVLGDDKYGAISHPAQNIHRLMLHACRLRLTHPVSGRVLDLKVPLPPDFSAALDIYRKKSECHGAIAD